jgi:CheY-like chemotaxis protein
MPVEDGFSLIRRIRNNSAFGRQLPAIALSAFADTRSEEAALAAGFSAFLAKPARPEALLGLIGRLLQAPEPTDPDTPRHPDGAWATPATGDRS